MWESPGPWIGLSLTFITVLVSLLVLAWRGGYHSRSVSAVEKEVRDALESINTKMDGIVLTQREDSIKWADYFQHRGRTDERLDRAEQDILRIRDQVHNTLVPKAQLISGLDERIKRLEREP